jgi:hypothetical protein
VRKNHGDTENTEEEMKKKVRAAIDAAYRTINGLCRIDRIE